MRNHGLESGLVENLDFFQAEWKWNGRGMVWKSMSCNRIVEEKWDREEWRGIEMPMVTADSR